VLPGSSRRQADFEANCPHCGAREKRAGASPGAVVDCTQCDRSFVLPAPGPIATPATASPPMPGLPIRLTGADPADHARRRAPSDVRLTWTGLLALGLTALFYAGVVWPLAGTYFGDLFGARGWVQYAISFLSLWSAVLLIDKWRRLARQTRALDFDLLPHAIAARITPESTPNFLAYLASLPEELSRNFLIERVRGGLEHYRARSNTGEVVGHLSAQAEADANAVDSSYTMIRVFIWAIPILGFIGTVIGIGASVGGFSESVNAAQDLDVMKDSLGAVTSGLGVAFDTTLLALVMSLFIMFPTSSLQKAEEDFLASVESYCSRHLVRRLGPAESESGEAEATGLRRAVDRLADDIVAALAERLATLR
jgi:biopolymer transport protein ExbB/TolQ